MTTNTKQMDKGGFDTDSPDEHINIDLCSSGKSMLKPSGSLHIHIRVYLRSSAVKK